MTIFQLHCVDFKLGKRLKIAFSKTIKEVFLAPKDYFYDILCCFDLKMEIFFI